MHIATAKLTGLQMLCFSRFHDTPKLAKELANDYEERTWRNKLHTDDAGMVQIPALAFKNCLSESAKYLSLQIQGKGKATYTKHFEAGVAVFDNIPLNIHKDDVAENKVFVPADGRRGSGTRVMRSYPAIAAGWTAEVPFIVMDDIISKEIFLQVLKSAGNLIGIGTFRVRNNGVCGRFKVESLDWQEVNEDALVA